MDTTAPNGSGPLPYLRELLARLEADHDQLGQRIATLKAEIARQERAAARAAAADRKPRRPRGENRRAIKALFAKDPSAQLSLQQIADNTNLPLSSVGVAVEKLQRQGLLVKDNDGRYSWEEPRPDRDPFETGQ